MASHTGQLDQLARKIEKLRREYDLYICGNRSTEPTALRAEVEREVLQLTRHPYSSTAMRFRLTSLAHRFRAVETQARNLIERRTRAQETESDAEAPNESVFLDQVALKNPRSVDGHFRKLHKALGGKGAQADLDQLRERLMDEASRKLKEGGATGVKFSVVKEDGALRLHGEVIRKAKKDHRD